MLANPDIDSQPPTVQITRSPSAEGLAISRAAAAELLTAHSKSVPSASIVVGSLAVGLARRI
jgi:hypothetical protein